MLAAVVALVLPLHHDDGCKTHACLERTCVKACIRRVEEKRWRREQRALDAGIRATLARLRGCETRGIPYPKNYHWRGHHRGAYQYDFATWAQAGGRGDPADASPAEQDVRTARFFPSHRAQWQCRA